MKSQMFRLRWDGKRYYLPATLRNQIGCRWVLTKREKGLALVSKPRWQSFLELVKTMKDSELRERLMRFKIAPACGVDLQKKDLYIPRSLMQCAGLGQGDALLYLDEDLGYILPEK